MTGKLGARLQGVLLKSPADGFQRRSDRLGSSVGLGEECNQHQRVQLGRRPGLPLGDPVAELIASPGSDSPAGQQCGGTARPRRDRTDARRGPIDDSQRRGVEEKIGRTCRGQDDVAQGLIHQGGGDLAVPPEAIELRETCQGTLLRRGRKLRSRVRGDKGRAIGAERERENDDRRPAPKYLANGAERELEATVVRREPGDLGRLLEPYRRDGRCTVATRCPPPRPARRPRRRLWRWRLGDGGAR